MAATLATLETEIGTLVAIVDNDSLIMLEFAEPERFEPQFAALGVRVSKERVLLHDHIETQLAEYFDGSRKHFDVPLKLIGTDFQKRVWSELLRIPFGETRSYGDLARTLGDPDCVRAVGMANGANRLAIVVPCHRVIGADGSLTGYGGGLWRKKRLLELEQGQIGLAI
jgi:O-6-methylguanine DNA methyltransferase